MTTVIYGWLTVPLSGGTRSSSIVASNFFSLLKNLLKEDIYTKGQGSVRLNSLSSS